MNAPALRCLSAALVYDRIRFRRCRTRLAFAEGALAASLAEWAASTGEDRNAARHLARMRMRHTRQVRKQLAGITATMRASHAQYLASLAVARGYVKEAA